ncbi:MAG: asparagine synthase (glutamine-hydrolyzing) [Candidatus Omnitrophica bacterium]|nr:asparagine synthase (glutamine-hydrolyzing) [Candidatus Omnitrophota bacterium]
MCGVAGYIGKLFIEKPKIRKTLDLMKNRGPDYCDYVALNNGSVNVVLLHSRLAIIDLEERANQPFTIGDCTLVFNGEIYNYIELRKRLEKQGVHFKTESDTEVLLQSYLKYGEECVHEFEGMWSFAIYDRKKGELFLSRDRFAEKPLYFLKACKGIFFGSEIKSIKSLARASLNVNHQQLLRYLVNGYKSLYKTGDTFFEEVSELPFATNLIVDNGLQLRFKRYWMPVHRPKEMTLDAAIQGFRHHLLESIKLRLRADVPLAFCLSGGIDSSAIVSIAAKYFNYDVATFSIIDSDERYNERKNIETTLSDLGCKHTIIDIPYKDFVGRLTDLIAYHDAPLYTISYYIHSFLSESISRQGYKVVCSGTAADELITGYYDHFNLYLYEMRSFPKYQKYLAEWKQYVSPYVRNPYLKNPELYFENSSFRSHVFLNNEEFSKYLKTEFDEPFTETRYCESLLRNRMMNELFHEGTRVILHEDDLNSMRYSVENRSPYLDSKLFEFSYSIPTEYLIQNGYGKYILREAVKGILNEKVRTERKKVGFNASINSAFDLNTEENKDYILENGRIFDFVRRDRIEQLLQERIPLPNSYSKFLFSFINAKIFLELNR